MFKPLLFSLLTVASIGQAARFARFPINVNTVTASQIFRESDRILIRYDLKSLAGQYELVAATDGSCEKTLSLDLFTGTNEDALDTYLISAIGIPLFRSKVLSPFESQDLGTYNHADVGRVEITRGSYKVIFPESNEINILINKSGIIKQGCSYKKIN